MSYKGQIYIEKADLEIPVLFKFDYTEAEPVEQFYAGCDEEVNITEVVLDAEQMILNDFTNDEMILAGKLFGEWINFEELEEQAFSLIEQELIDQQD